MSFPPYIHVPEYLHFPELGSFTRARKAFLGRVRFGAGEGWRGEWLSFPSQYRRVSPCPSSGGEWHLCGSRKRRFLDSSRCLWEGQGLRREARPGTAGRKEGTSVSAPQTIHLLFRPSESPLPFTRGFFALSAMPYS